MSEVSNTVKRELHRTEIDAVFHAADRAPIDFGSRIIPFDFRRPDRIAGSQVQAIRTLHESFVRNLAPSLSAYLRSYLTVNLLSVEQLAYGEFVEALPAPTFLLSLSLSPYDGSALIELSPSLTFPIIEIMLGGDGHAAGNPMRQVTELERTLLEALFHIVISDLRDAWKAVAPIGFNFQSVATEPRMVRILEPNEAVVSVCIEIRIGEICGHLNLAIPSTNIRMMGTKLDQEQSLRQAASAESEPPSLNLGAQLGSAARRTLARPEARRQREAGPQKKGELLPLGHRVNPPPDGDVNGRDRFPERVVNSNQRKAFLIESMPASV